MQFGYNVQYGRAVIGLEADYQAAAIGNGSKRFTAPLTDFVSTSKIDGFGTIRGRVGYAFDRFLPYVTGGFAAAHNESTLSGLAAQVQFSDDHVHTGWVVGGGLEYGANNGWSGKIEYLHVDLSTAEYFQSGLLQGPGFYTMKPSFDVVRTGVNYHF